jgi:asparagine synthase (glutamine-hydrolysing)
MVQTALEIYNKGCGEFGIETRFPFIDKRLAEYCLAIPGNQKISQGYTRIIVRRALQGILPEEIRWRTDKGDLGWSFISGFNAKREFVGTTIESSNLFLDRFFDVGFLKRVYGRCNSGKAIADDLLTLFLVVVLSAWNARMAPH